MRPLHDKIAVRRDLRSMLADGMAFSVMVGCGESYFPAFALALGFGDVSAGLISTLPMWIGSVLQLISPAAVTWLRSHRRWVVTCASLQAASFLPLILGAITGRISETALFAVASLYWGFGMATGPAWNAWVGRLVPEELRARFFASRARWSQLALVLGLGAGGLLLDGREVSRDALRAFAVVFALAASARALSACCLSRQRELPLAPADSLGAAVRPAVEVSTRGGHARLLAYLLGVHFSVYIASPYFTPYMLGPLGLSYREFTFLIALAFVARVVSLPALGRVARRSGTKRLLWIGSLGIVPLPALWLVSNHIAYLAVLQLASGVVWAAFELATLLSFFDQIPADQRTRVLSFYNTAHATAIVVGSAVGGWLLGGGERSLETYALLMLVSTVARALACIGLRGIRDSAAPRQPLALRTISVRPSSGGLQRPVLPALSEKE